MKEEKIKVYYDKDVDYKDEWYCSWFKCPNCGGNSIAHSFSFCPNCGKAVEIIEVDNQTQLKKEIQRTEVYKQKAELELQQLKKQLRE